MKVPSGNLGGVVAKTDSNGKMNEAVKKSKNSKKKWRKAVRDNDAVGDDDLNDEVASNLSDLSGSTETDEHSAEKEGSKANKQSSNKEGIESQDYENFERTLRNKHSKACKAMSVSCLVYCFFIILNQCC